MLRISLAGGSRCCTPCVLTSTLPTNPCARAQVFLDKTWFTPVGDMLDKRDSMIREKLTMFKGNTNAVAELQEEAESIIAEARSEAQKTVNAAKTAAQATAAEKLAAMKTVRRISSRRDGCMHTIALGRGGVPNLSR